MKKVIIKKRLNERSYSAAELAKMSPEELKAAYADIKFAAADQAKNVRQKAVPLDAAMEKRIKDIVVSVLKSPAFTQYLSAITTKKAGGLFKSLTKKMKKPEIDVDAATAVMEEGDIIEHFINSFSLDLISV